MLSKALRSTLAVALTAALLTQAGVSFAADGQMTAEQIVEALKPRKTRGLSAKPTKSEMERAKLIDNLKETASTRALSVPERNQLADAVKDKPSIDMVIYFEFNSAEISPRSKDSLAALGSALQDESLKQASIMIAGHTDAKGRSTYNQSLSERRAQAVKDYLMKTYNLASSMITVGYGAEKLKIPSDPFSGENRRVQIVNLTDNRVSDAGANK